ncbi:MAG: HAMP domain-containing protein [Gammaproteobacteria bacterium]|nr:HAMP domain-containing protein [Gammaproteobacteria bacterium]
MSDTSGSVISQQSVVDVGTGVIPQQAPRATQRGRFAHPRRPRFGIPIAYKLALAITLLITLGMGLLGFVVVTNQQQLMRDQINAYGETVAQQLADAATEPVLSDDRLNLSALMKNVAESASINGAAVLSDKGEALAKTGLLPLLPIEELYAKSTRLAGGTYGYDWLSGQVSSNELVSFLAPISFKDLTAGHIVVTMSRSAVSRSIRDAIRTIVAATIALNVLTIIAAFFMSKRISRPIHSLLFATEAISNGNYQYRIKQQRKDEIGSLITGFNRMAEGLEAKSKVENVFSRFVSEDVASEVLRNIDRVELGGKNVVGTVLFADIVGFTQISENLTPLDIASLLNEHFTYIARVSELCNGTIDKFMGDCAMVQFGVLKDDPDHRFHAIACAVMIKKLMEKLNVSRMRQGKPAVFFSIGINSGEMMAGNLGSENRMHYTVVGDVVNLASRLSEKAGGGQILITEALYEYGDIKRRVKARPHEPLEIRGKAGQVKTYVVNQVTGKYKDAMDSGIDQLLAGDT